MIKKELFGKLRDGTEVYAYTLINDSIVSARIITYGGCMVNLWVKDKNGEAADVICGYDDLESYLNDTGYYGAIVGRVCNRISNSRFTLDGVEYKLYTNYDNISEHGGKIGFDKRLWNAVEIDSETEPAVELTYFSPDLEENYPGNLTVKVTYTLTSDGGISMRFKAFTDKKTIVNLINHNYYNLAGYETKSIKDHILWVDADSFNELDYNLVPTGEFTQVEGTVFDFRTPKVIGKDFRDPTSDKMHGGFDNNFIINNYDYNNIKKVAYMIDPKSGRRMDVYTNQPCVLIYTGNWINEEGIPYKGGVKPTMQCAVCFETQKMPDSINHKGFTDITLAPGEVYDYTTVYKFSN